MNNRISGVTAACLLALSSGLCMAQSALEEGFKNPPQQARPHTWWHWMNGNVSRKGITADLEAMKRVGLGGAQIFNVSESIPEGPIQYNSDEWRGLVKFAAQEANRLGLELCIHNCAGWSSSGGPWVKPENAMQMVTISEVHVKGPGPFKEELKQPKTNAGFYRDIAIVAFPTPKDEAFRIKDFRHKALYEYSYGQQPSMDAVPAEAVIKADSIIDLTASEGANGHIDWTIPEGDWTVLRIGYTPTGAVNAPAPNSGRGLEVDKLSREAFDAYWAGGMEPLIKDLGPLAGTTLKNCLIDSYEVGCQNWTPKFADEFKKRRGYDLLKFLPAMTGRVVAGGPESERFLTDVRRTVSDLFTDNYYSYFAQKCKEKGILASVEPYDGPFECTQVGKDADILMGEFWVTGGMSNSCKLAADVSHVYGKKIIGSESFTAEPNPGRWQNHPGSLKAVGDLTYTMGINRYIIHCFAHQPWTNVEPGMTMGQWGTHFSRTTTWFEQGSAWISYLARCQYLLQEGRFAADVLYFAGDAAPNSAPFETSLKAHGYDYDACGPDALMTRVGVKDGKLVLPDGMTYRVLVLPDSQFMSAKSVTKIKELVAAGATVIGPKPTMSPNAATPDSEIAKVGSEVWGDCDGKTVKSHGFGKGRVMRGNTTEEALTQLNVAPDTTFATSDGSKINAAWIHRTIGDSEVYFVSNQLKRSQQIECSFRVAGNSPQLWHAESGVIEPAPVWNEKDGRTVVSLPMDAAGSVFVVFKKGSRAPHLTSIAAPLPPQALRMPPKIVVTKARYDAIDGAGGVDGTAKVKDLVEHGEFTIPATNTLFGDPTYNHAKKLTVEFTMDGKAMTKSAAENEMVVLFDMTGPDLPAPFAVRSTDRGVEVRMFANGTYTAQTSEGRAVTLANQVPEPLVIEGPWEVRFQSGRGAPAAATFASLTSWSENSDPGIRYFSGAATYKKVFDVPPALAGSAHVFRLNLGNVREIAEVTLNGKKLGIWWKAPFETDVTELLQAGKNTLEVRVTNLWVNRLIGDEQLPADVEWNGKPIKKWPEWFDAASEMPLKNRTAKDRLTFTTWHHWTKDSPLMESGLIGPVQIRIGEVKQID